MLGSRHILKKIGYASVAALTAEEALTWVEKNRFALAFLDAKLPDMEGLELAAKIRVIDPKTRLLIVSGYFYRDDKDIQEALDQGLIMGFIAKPFDQRDIVKAVKGQEAPSTSSIKNRVDFPQK
jgi:response regulator RpfG family c-di-GMP phosphodiesterase